jgi:hypothetical protein
MLLGLGEPYEWQDHDANAAKFEAVLRTSWDELAERGWSNRERSTATS